MTAAAEEEAVLQASAEEMEEARFLEVLYLLEKHDEFESHADSSAGEDAEEGGSESEAEEGETGEESEEGLTPDSTPEWEQVAPMPMATTPIGQMPQLVD